MIKESTKTVWYGVYYKLPKGYVAGAVPGTIPGHYGSGTAGFFVPAQTQEEAKKRAMQMFVTYRKRWGEHAFTADQVKKLSLNIKRLTKEGAGEEELSPILERPAKMGEKLYLYSRIYTVIRVIGKGKETKFPSDYLPKNISSWVEAINPEGTKQYTGVVYAK
jgi:hypothetical protein